MSRSTRVLVVAVIVSFCAFLDGAITNVALPAISEEMGGGLVLQQWVVDAYLLTLGSLILIAGSLSDSFGRLRIIRIGLYGFGVTSLLCAVAPTGEILVVARALQGAAGALLVPSSLALIVSTFSGAEQGRAIGRWTAWTTSAFLVGPLLGGLLVDAVSWRLIFAINILPIVAVLVLMRPLGRDEPLLDRPRVDWLGAVLGVVGLGGTVFALIEQGRFGWGSPVILVPFVAGVVALVLFIWWEGRVTAPMLPLALFRACNFAVGNLSTWFVYAGFALGPFAITIFVQEIGGYTAFQAGLATLPPTIMLVLLGSWFGGLSGRFGPRLFMAVGPLVAAVGFLLTLAVDADAFYWTQFFPGVLLLGLGMAITVAPLTSAILGAVDPSHAGIGSAVNNAIARIAGLVAVALSGVIVGSALDVVGYHRAAIATAIMLAIGGVISALGITNRPEPVRVEALVADAAEGPATGPTSLPPTPAADPPDAPRP
ncbi:MFS transporter [Agromyces mangrovi Wang et al. 2018]|uniref:MFS transporter n=1 Tax=Agromyces mangrovi TaxID=1858653 RepID=UPI002573F5E3|nr:MFS transporter [Agromyces mangrovi]BDZ66391.1 MFS transporter [Agromyces mangrovi]